MSSLVSVVIPVLNERDNLTVLLSQLVDLLSSLESEIIVVDGGSHDGTQAVVKKHQAILIESAKPGRAAQMNLGADNARGQMLVFLHADTQLPRNTIQFLNSLSPNQWGFFPVKLSGDPWLLRVVETFMNWRSRLTRIATGDQCLCVGKNLFERLGGFAEIPLMEDVEICKRLRKVSRPQVASEALITSSRRWEEKGVWRTILLMWRLRLGYFCGQSPQVLVTKYYPKDK